MIADAETATSIRLSWEGVTSLRGKVQRSTLFSFAHGAPVGLLTDAAYNLPFMHAYAVLNDVLEAFAQETGIGYRGRELGRLLAATKDVLPWIDFQLISYGQTARNAVAHRGELLPRAECWRYIDAIEVELVGWRCIPAPLPPA